MDKLSAFWVTAIYQMNAKWMPTDHQMIGFEVTECMFVDLTYWGRQVDITKLDIGQSHSGWKNWQWQSDL